MLTICLATKKNLDTVLFLWTMKMAPMTDLANDTDKTFALHPAHLHHSWNISSETFTSM